MATPGNDPFSGTNTRDLLQHIISPKVVSDGATGYTVKTDMINIDSVYASSGVITKQSGGNAGLQFQDSNGTEVFRLAALGPVPSRNIIQSTVPLYFNQIGTAQGNTYLQTSVAGTNGDVLTVGGEVGSVGTRGFRVYAPQTSPTPPVLKMVIVNSANQSYIQSDDVIYFSRIGGNAKSSLSIGVDAALDLLTVGGTITIGSQYNPTTPTTVTMGSSYNGTYSTEIQNAPSKRFVTRGTTPSSATSFQIFNIGEFITFGSIFHWVYRDVDGNLAWGHASKNGANAVGVLQAGTGNNMTGTTTSGGVTITVDSVDNTNGIKITTSNTSKTYSVTVTLMNVV